MSNNAIELLIGWSTQPASPAKHTITISGLVIATFTWTFDYRVKYGPLGWLIGQTMMKIMMGKIIDANLQGLAEKARAR